EEAEERRPAPRHHRRRRARSHETPLEGGELLLAFEHDRLEIVDAGGRRVKTAGVPLELRRLHILRFRRQPRAPIATARPPRSVHRSRYACAVATGTPGANTIPGRAGIAGSGNSSVPRPIPTARPPSRKKGTSLPSC